MADTSGAPAPAGKKKFSATTLVLIVVLILLIIMAIPYFGQVGRYKQGVALYEEEKYTEANTVLKGLRGKFPASVLMGGRINKALGLCKAEMASDIAMNARTEEGYTKALALLEEAAKLAGSTEEIQRRIKEYSDYKAKLAQSPAPAPAGPAAPSAESEPPRAP